MQEDRKMLEGGVWGWRSLGFWGHQLSQFFWLLLKGVWDGSQVWVRDGESLGKNTKFGDHGRQQGLLAVPSSPDTKIRFFIRGCGQYNSYRCQEKRNTYFSEYWYQAQCCQYDYCNSWSSPQLQSSMPDPPTGALALPLSESQIQWFYKALNLSLPLPSFHAGKEPEGRDPVTTLSLNLSLSIADLRRIYLSLNSSGLLVLP